MASTRFQPSDNLFQPIRNKSLSRKHAKKVFDADSSRNGKLDKKLVTFDDHLQQYVACIIERSKQDILDTEQSLLQELEHLSLQYETKCNVLAEAEQYLLTPVTTECLQLLDKTGQDEESSVLLRDQMQAFKTIVEAKQKKVTGLWREWTSVQVDFIRLTIEIFGNDSIVADCEAPDAGFGKPIEDARSEFEKNVATRLAAKNAFTDVEQRLAGLTSETVASLEAHLKSIRIGHNKKMLDLKKAMETAGFT